jgi:hypothetical protein
MEHQPDRRPQRGSGHSGRHSSGSSHRRHHGHSSGRHSPSSKPYAYPRRPRLEDNPKREKEKKIESLFTKNIFTIFGIIFLAGAIWFGIDNWKSIESYIGTSLEKSAPIDISMVKKAPSAQSVFQPAPLYTNPNVQPSSYVSFVVLALVFILAALAVSIRRKIIALRMVTFFAYLFLVFWMLIRFYLTSDTILFYFISVLSTLFFILFFISGFVDSFSQEVRWKFRTEYWFILLNSLFYYLIIKALLYKSSHSSYESVFVFFLSSFHLFTIYFTDKKNLIYNKIPYLLATLIITCLFLPLIFRENSVIIFISPLTIFLVLFSKYSRNQTSVIFALLGMMVMTLIYMYQWGYEFAPDIAVRDGVRNFHLFLKGLISSIFVLAALSINNNYLKKLAIAFSQKWMKKIHYLKYLKATLLIVTYLSGYWIFNYLVQMILKDERTNILIWFTYNCLYFIIYIPRLARQRSSFFRLILISAMISTLSWFTFVHIHILGLRRSFIELNELPAILFYCHYIALGILIWLLFTLLHYFKRAFPGKKTLIKGFWVYLYVMCTFILLSEFDHLAVLIMNGSDFKIETILENTKKLPYSLLLILSSSILITIGFLVQSRFLRIFSLFILGAVLVKILVYDVVFMNPHSKILLFFVLGIVLLGLSVSYPKIRRAFFQKDTPQSHRFFTGNRKF